VVVPGRVDKTPAVGRGRRRRQGTIRGEATEEPVRAAGDFRALNFLLIVGSVGDPDQTDREQLTKGQRRPHEDWAGEKGRRVVPLGRWQEPEDSAARAVFLASAGARNVAGQTVNVDAAA
jgi:hypothetical protein